MSKSSSAGGMFLVEVTGGALSKFEKYFCHSLKSSLGEFTMEPSSFLTFPAGHGVVLSHILFIIFQTFRDDPCRLACSRLSICFWMNFLSSS